jgi:asparagine synthase (glutamine-hydrolysing)
MCGIAGIVNARLAAQDIDAALGRMQRAMFHRGPDEAGAQVFADAHAGLCARRLSIVDLERGKQPIANEDETLHAVLNGEIYNHKALRAQLKSLGHSFRTASDTEVVVHLYEQYGIDFLGKLEGMFALAVYDGRRRRLLLARDGAGMKPLYFANTNRGFVFASEAKALFASRLIGAEANVSAMNVYLAAGFVPAPMTAFSGIEKLPAGGYLLIDQAGSHSGAFWELRYREPEANRSDADCVEELDGLLKNAVRSHLQADVPVGVYLSGGWDSSLTATFASEQSGSILKTFSIVFPDDPGADESRFSRRIAKHLGTDHHEIEYRSALLPGLLRKIARHLEEPCSTVPTGVLFVLASLASQHVKTVLSGEGADELFGGYERFRIQYPYLLRRLALRAPLQMLAERCSPGRFRRALRILSAGDERAADAEWNRVFTPGDKLRVLRPEYRMPATDLEPVLLRSPTLETCQDILQRRLAFELGGRLPNAILSVADKMSMAHSLEVRMPFLDRSIVEFALRLPSRLKVHRGHEKVIVSHMAGRYLPAEVASRRKKGLAYPVGAWRRHPLKNFVRELLLSSDGPIDRRYVERQLPIWLESQTGEENQISSLMALQSWWHEFMGAGAVESRSALAGTPA